MRSPQEMTTVLPTLLQDTDPRKSQRVMEALRQMKKIDVARLERAHDAEAYASASR